jgi:hypothetical protein
MSSQLSQAQRAEFIRQARKDNARAIAQATKFNGHKTKYIEVDVTELRSTVVAMRHEIDALRE